MLMKSTNQRCNAFASVLGLFLHSSRVPECVIDTLARMFISIGPSAINSGIDSLEKNMVQKIVALGKTFTAAFVYDYFDIEFGVATPTIENGGNARTLRTSRAEHLAITCITVTQGHMGTSRYSFYNAER